MKLAAAKETYAAASRTQRARERKENPVKISKWSQNKCNGLRCQRRLLAFKFIGVDGYEVLNSMLEDNSSTSMDSVGLDVGKNCCCGSAKAKDRRTKHRHQLSTAKSRLD